MSARDSESGSSTYKGGSGRAGGLGNGGIGGGMGGGGNYGGGMGGGAGRMGGIGSRTGLTTGTQMYGGMAFGRPGGNAMNPGAWGIRERSPITQGPLNRPTRPGLLGNPTPTAVPGVNPVPEYVPALEDVPMPTFQDPMAMYTTLTPPPAAPYNPLGSIQPPPSPSPSWFKSYANLNTPGFNYAYDSGQMNLNKITNEPRYTPGPTINNTAGMPGRGYSRGPN